MDAKRLLESFLGGQTGGQGGAGGGQGLPWGGGQARPPAGGSGLGGMLGGMLGGGGGAGGGVGGLLDQAKGMLGRTGVSPGMAGLAGGAGLLALLMGGKGLRGLASHGGAAALGALAFKAYQQYQAGQAAQPAQLPADPAQLQMPPGAAPEDAARNQEPFALALVRAMVAAANSDGHIDATERQAILSGIQQSGVEQDATSFVMDAMSKPSDAHAIAALAANEQQAAQLYLASRLAIEPDHPAERVYLRTLAEALKLPEPLVRQLEAQVLTGSGA